MGESTKIEWCDHTFNAWRGCTKVSPACANCYAERWAKRNPRVFGKWGEHGTRVVAAPAAWNEPIRWNANAEREGLQKLVFCCSLADVFEDWQGPMYRSNGERIDSDANGTAMQHTRSDLFAAIDATPRLTWLLLTKRPENILRMLPDRRLRRNVWFGTTVESEEYFGRIDSLQECRSYGGKLFLSCEPLLGPMQGLSDRLDLIDWVIAGGESGSNARVSLPAWFRNVRDACSENDVPFLFKQWGEHDMWGDRVGKEVSGRVLDGVLHDAFPEGAR